MILENLISRALRLPPDALVYQVSRTLSRVYSDQFVLETEDMAFDLAGFVNAKKCQLKVLDYAHAQFESSWVSLADGGKLLAKNAFFKVTWNDSRLTLLRLDYSGRGGDSTRWYIMGPTKLAAQDFFAAVCTWQGQIRSEILVYRHGSWQKDAQLYDEIAGASLDSLVLGGSLKEELVRDFESFFAAEEFYKGHGVPWKRGLLLLGPPGNGKTHSIKALVNRIGKPCLYVRTFGSNRFTSHQSIERVFKFARRAAPCILVFEDLDSLIDSKNRSFFLNEMDGFAMNRGILTVASTNHPEKLDPAILDRPSRFDRKYTFELPGQLERETFLLKAMERYRIEDGEELRRLAALAEGFSFAYLKELVLSAAMVWVNAGAGGRLMDSVFAMVETLRGQMVTAASTVEIKVVDEEEPD
jgi:hypothetical protein